MNLKLKNFSVLLILLCSFSAFSQNWDQIIKTTASDRDASDYYGKAVAIDGNFAIVGAWGEDEDVAGLNTLAEAGSAYILQNISGTWTEVQKIVASDRAANDNFGYSVDISGDFAVVGAWKEAHDAAGLNPMVDAGSVYIFQNIAGTWTEVQKIVPSDRAGGDNFGHSVAIDQNFIVVGAFNEDEDESGLNTILNAGSAYVFNYSGAIWIEQQKLVASDRAAADFFGFDVDISGSTIIIGAYGEDEDFAGANTMAEAGSAYLFENIGPWVQMTKIIANDRMPGDYFGYSVAINEPFVIVGAYEADLDASGANPISNAGAAYYFDSHSGLPFPLAKLVASDREEDDRFGYDVAINLMFSSYIVVGAYFEDEDELGTNEMLQSGSVYVFNPFFVETQKLVSLDRAVGDYFGCAVGLSGQYIISGAQFEDEDPDGNNTRPEAGSAYIFQNCREINVFQSTDIADGGTFDFGDVDYGSSSSELTFTIENTGYDNLILDGIPKVEISGTDAADFAINQSSTTSPVIAGGSTTFTIIFTPSSTTLHTAEISISNNDTDENPYNFTITGTGAKLPQTITFGALPAKTYGDADFTVSATATSSLDVVFTSSDPLVATCGGTNGEVVTIVGAGTCSIHANQAGDAIYEAAPQISQTLVVDPKHLEVTADVGQTKEYGDADPIFTYSITSGSLESGDSFTGSCVRDAGETVGFYSISEGTLTAGTNYDMVFVEEDFEITERTIYVTADAGQSKVYGTSDPGLTYSYNPALIGGDSFSGNLARVAGEDAGFYEIQQGTLSLNSNYILDYTSDDFEITAKDITVTPNAGLSKIYGTADPVLTYTYTPALSGGDSFSGSLSRDPGEDAGFYAITAGTLTAGSNYNLTIAPEYMEIIAKPITVVATNMQSKAYGDSDPTFTYYTLGSLESGDSFSGSLSRDAGEDLGLYAITLGTLSAGANYNVSFTSSNFEIKVKNIMIIPDADQTKEYGDADPVLTFTTTSPIAPWDTWSGALDREAGETVGTYDINQGTLALNSNYNISFPLMPVEFEITKKSIVVTADLNQTKEYGDANPTYTYTYTGTLAGGDSFSGNLTRDPGEAVGTYNINQGSLWISSNYLIFFVSNEFEITTRAITVDADVDQSKEYGDSDPVYTYTVTGTLVGGDAFSGSLTRIAGEDVGNYQIQQGTLALSSNYNIIYNPADFEITAKEITVTADAGQSKEYNDPDPTEYTYTLTTGALVGGDSFTGALTREAGEGIGTYEIQQGTLDAGTNYNLSYESDYFEITQKIITVTADMQPAKIYGDEDPGEFGYTYTPELFVGDEFTGELIREVGEDVGTYEIQIGTLQLSSIYYIDYISSDFEIIQRDMVVDVDNGQTKVYGEADPVFTYTYTGELVGTDDFTGELSREAGEDAGFYEIQQGSLDLGTNYYLTFNSADFEITKADPVITWANPADIYYPTALSPTQLNAVADVPGTFGYDPIEGTVLEIGDNQELMCEFTPDDMTNYNIVVAYTYINVLLNSKVETNSKDLKIYPNPTRGNLFIDFGETTDASIKVLDITGKVVVERTTSNSVETIDMSELPAGVYIISITPTSIPLSQLNETKRIKVVVR